MVHYNVKKISVYLIFLLCNSFSGSNIIFFDDLDTLHDVYIAEDVNNEFQVEELNERQRPVAKVKTHANLN